MDKITRVDKYNGGTVEMTPNEFVEFLNSECVKLYRAEFIETLKRCKVIDFYDWEFTFTYGAMLKVMQLV